MPLHMHPPNEVKMWVMAKNKAASETLRLRTRVDEQALKRQKLDALPKLLEEIRRAKADNPQLVVDIPRS